MCVQEVDGVRVIPDSASDEGCDNHICRQREAENGTIPVFDSDHERAVAGLVLREDDTLPKPRN